MRQAWVAALAGFVFALGLGIAGMTQPQRVTGFLDLGGRWDPSLLFVMMGAIGVHMPVALWQRRGLRRTRAEAAALGGCAVAAPRAKLLDPALVGGAAVFGVGWGMGGFCPGPAFVAAGSGATSAVVFIVGMAAGMAVLHTLRRASSHD